MYRPLKDLNGIPGAKSLMICLTGYQRQDRDDVMVCICLFYPIAAFLILSTDLTSSYLEIVVS
jgi:hypothetical protein